MAFKEILNKNEGNSGSSPRHKYQSSSLAEDNKTMLNNSIMKVFESDEIFSTEFNMQKLAALVSSNYNNVSQVVNEQFGKNFNQLLNEYRIAEACRRLNDIEHYGKHTIEAIGESVGYGSRSTFITQFKLLTGMTPSDFQHQAKA
jgi:AraC-like DNA-binding protein